MEQIKTLPIIDTSEPMVGCNMHDTMDIIYEKYAKSINIKKFLPVLPTKIDKIPIGFNYNIPIDIFDSYKFVKCKVLDLVVICILLKRERHLKKINKKRTDYYIICIGTNNIVNIFDIPFSFDIKSRSNTIYNDHIHKSTLPGLEQGTTVTKICNALIQYFQPDSFTRIDAAQITCKNGDKFYLSWLRLLTKPTDTADLSWYNSFGLKRVSPYVSNKQKLADTIDRIKHITAKELEDYYEKVIDLFSSEKYTSILVDTYIPNGYFLYLGRLDMFLVYDSAIKYSEHPRRIYKHSLDLVKKESSSTTLTEILQKGSCEDRAALLGTMPLYAPPGWQNDFPGFAGFHDTELKKEAIFPHLKDIMTLGKYITWNTRTYSFKNKKRSACKSKTQKKKRT
jgi:hypothetical protein